MAQLNLVSELALRWEDARRRGENLSPEELCLDHPDLLEPLRAEIRILESMDPFLGSGSLFLTPRSTDTPTTDIPPLPDLTGTRYRILRFLGAGGLGQVYLAFDEELGREVALKFIRPGIVGSDSALKRFQREAEVTSRLEHPSIPPVFGVVRNPRDGSLCYAMRFIDGEPLHRVIERYHQLPAKDSKERERTLRSLTNHILNVCRTVAFAHDRGYLHRDIKPGNIMVGRYEETWLLDWGLAGRFQEALPVSDPDSTIRADDSLTRAGVGVGTPGFMAPEQANGDWANVGPSADLYSIGVTIACVLAGRGPKFGEPIDAFLQSIPNAPAPLLAIARKAAQPAPVDRYPSAAALRDDLENYLADEPISAFRDPFSVRVRRWASHHRTAVIASILTLCTAVVGLSLGLLAVNAEREETIRERNTAIDAQAKEEIARNRANEQRDLAMKTMRTVVNDIYAQTAGKPTLRELQERLLTAAQKSLTKLVSDDIPDEDVDSIKLQVFLELGQLFNDAKLENLGDARRQCEYATQLAKRRLQASPDSPEAQRNYALSRMLIADLLFREAKPSEALIEFRQAEAIFRSLAQSSKDSPTRYWILRCVRGRNAALEMMGDASTALEGTREEFTILDELIAADPENLSLKLDLATASERLGVMLLGTGAPLESLNYLRIANSANLQLLKRNPMEIEPLFNLSMSTHQLANTCWLVGFPQAEGYTVQSESLLDMLAKTDAGHIGYQLGQINHQVVVLNLRLSQGKLREALTAAERWNQYATSAAKKSRGNVLFEVERTNSYLGLGLVSQWSNDDTKALEHYRTGLERFTTLEKAGKLADFPIALAYGEWFRMKIASLEDRHADALKIAEPFANRRELMWFGPFHAACVFARASKTSPEHAPRALAMLRQAAKFGLWNREFLLSCPDLAPLRDRDDFQQWLRELEAKKSGG